MAPFLKWFVLAVTAGALAACGGGSGGDSRVAFTLSPSLVEVSATPADPGPKAEVLVTVTNPPPDGHLQLGVSSPHLYITQV